MSYNALSPTVTEWPPSQSPSSASPTESPTEFPTESPPSPPSASPTESPPSPPPASSTESPPSSASASSSALPPPPALPPPSPPENGKLSVGTLAGIIVGVIGGVMLLAALGVFFILRRRQRMSRQGLQTRSVESPDEPSSGSPQHWKQNPSPPPDYKVNMLPKPLPSLGISSNPHRPPVHHPTFPELPSTSSSLGSEKQSHQSPSPRMALGFSQSTFTYEELETASNGFSDANFLGKGGFGYVHKGVLSNGKLVAIKQLKAGSVQGEREFQAEVDIITRVHHRHLVSLVGYCVSGAQRMLVYEFVPNNTLEFHLHGKGRSVMKWPNRMKIALGSAKGLAYLHEDCQPKTIHRDIKAANILIDYSFEPKVSDFGLAKIALDSDTHVSTRIMGTFGYLAPEYASSGKLTDKSDVYSFGVLLLELITGCRPVYNDESTVDWATPLLTQALEDGNFDSLVDPRLQKDYDSNEMARLVASAAACVRHSAKLRPRMSQIVRALEGNMALGDLNERVTPGRNTAFNSPVSSDYNSSQYREGMQKFRRIEQETQEPGRIEYSGPTSKYGLNQSSSSTDG